MDGIGFKHGFIRAKVQACGLAVDFGSIYRGVGGFASPRRRRSSAAGWHRLAPEDGVVHVEVLRQMSFALGSHRLSRDPPLAPTSASL